MQYAIQQKNILLAIQYGQQFFKIMHFNTLVNEKEIYSSP